MINREKNEPLVKAEIDNCIPPQPKIFPGDLDEFLRLIVRAKTPADDTKRFRDFLRWKLQDWYHAESPEPVRKSGETPKEFEEQIERYREKEQRRKRDVVELGENEIRCRIEKTVAQQMEKYRDDGISRMHWQSLAADYREWWKLQRRAKAAESGKKGVEAKAAKNPLHGESAADD